ncbi:hypothetical protein [Psychrobacillus soli]|uniref:Uncharacterized protein n=1 Tax=Psychrobacillus soli TaxID=1543965 RepID=A0A544TJ30_9BACI|nr:hypothetical protein [Psychrobacillus soli]TQR17454.1 hypothetical protein FG383_05200 [Psychrobacillus soli]
MNVIKLYLSEMKKNGPLYALEFIKGKTKVKDVNSSVDKLFNNPISRKSLVYKAFPPTFDNMNKMLNYYYQLDDFKKDLLWHSRVFSKIHKEINEILEYKAKIFNFLFHGEIQPVLELLGEFEEKYGINLWVIETKLKVYQEFYGFDKQKEYSSKVLENSNVPDLYKLLVKHFSVKAEGTVTPSKYERDVYKTIYELAEGDLETDIAIYLSNKLSLNYIQSQSVGVLLAIDSRLPMLDRYDSFVKVLLNYLKNEEIDEVFISNVYENIRNINDPEFKNLFLPYITDSQLNDYQLDLKAIEIIDSYTLGDYEKTILLCEELLKEKPWCVDFYEVYVKSLVYMKKDTERKFTGLLARIIELFCNFYKQEKNEIEYLDDIIKISYDYSLNIWAWKLIAMAFQTKINLQEVKEYGRVSDGFKFYWLVKPQIFNEIFPENKLEKILNRKFANVKSLTNDLHNAFLFKNIEKIKKLNISNERKNKYTAVINQRVGNYEEALRFYDIIQLDNTRLSKFEILVEKIKIYQHLGEYGKSTKVIIDSFIEGFNLIDDVDLKEILDHLEIIDKDNSNIDYPIVYELFTRYVGSEKEELRSDILEDFLNSFDVELVSELKEIELNIFDKNKLIYFLKEVCVIDVLSKLWNIDTEHEAEEERIAICNLLAKIDSNNVEVYTEEIKEITRIKRIKTVKRAIETSKIYIDENGLKNLLKRSLKETYVRFENFKYKEGGLLDEVYQFSMNSYIISMPKNEKIDIFEGMVKEIRDQFVFSKEYGLDGYLSVGIRHGTLVGQLRGALESSKLITIKDSISNQYVPNDYLIELVDPIDELNKEKFISALNKFSENFDDIVGSLKEEKVQITTESNYKEDSYFNYTITKRMINSLYISLNLNNGMSLDQFIDHIINYIWFRTERNLEMIKKYITSEFLNLINSYFDQLLVDIENIKVRGSLTDLKRKIIETKTNMTHEIDEVSSWFNRSEGLNVKEFDIDLSYEIGLEVSNKINMNKSIKFKVENSLSQPIEGKKLRGFVDIFVIIFDNIFKRSGLLKEIPVHLKFIEEDDHFVLECKNKVSFENESLEERLTNIEKNRKVISELDYRLVSTEGGSGLLKILKILKIDLGFVDSFIDYKIIDDEFILTIKMKF